MNPIRRKYLDWRLKLWCCDFIRKPAMLLTWLYYKAFCSRKKFIFQGKTYRYFYHLFNYTFLTERAVEIPIAQEAVLSYRKKKVLEVGNVLAHYFDLPHEIVDKYEKGPGVSNEDIVDFNPGKKYDLIISVSTLEHIGWDEKPRQPQKILQAVKKMKSLLTKQGSIIVTLPLGQNPQLDRLLNQNRLGFTQKYYLKRISFSNSWQEVDKKAVTNAIYSYPYAGANGLVIGVFLKVA